MCRMEWSASVGSNGFYISHRNSTDERTSSSALILDGCVLWNTLQLRVESTNIVNCTSLPLDTAYLYQADATGEGSVRTGEVP